MFLDRQIAGWEERYARFIASDGASEPVLHSADPPQAADFVMTIAGLARRRGASWTMIGVAMMAGPNRQLLDGAMLSLLVSADQCCPAIIGQAHLLYYSGVDGAEDRLEQALGRLRRDAQGLLDAIAGVEAAAKSTLLE
jgi:hypothetical protein